MKHNWVRPYNRLETQIQKSSSHSKISLTRRLLCDCTGRMQIRALGILALGARSAEARYRPKHLNTRSLDATPGSKSPSVSNASRPGSFEPKAIAYFPYTATNPGEPLRPEGFITFQYLAENAARIEVRLSNLPEGKGPFSYHIHTARVPDVITDPTPQCKDALAHLDPYGVGEPFKCDPSQRQSCQVGDVRLSVQFSCIPY